MPTKEQMIAVTQRIGWFQSMSFLRIEGEISHLASGAYLPWWENLSRDEQKAVLSLDVNWQGFSAAQRDDVINRVLSGESEEFWMDGIRPDNGRERFKRLVSQDEAATVDHDSVGLHQVWHKSADGFQHVANVQGNWMAAVVLTMVKPGAPGTEGVTWLREWERPSNFGDMIVAPSGKAFEIYDHDYAPPAIRETMHPAVEAGTRTGQQESGREKDQFIQILESKPEAGESLQKYGQFLTQATEQAMSGMQGKEKERER
jgi:hypothetical protein